MIYNSKLDYVKKYSVCYSKVSTNKLLEYDLLVLEPSATTKNQILELKQKGKIVIAYLSVLEISQAHQLFFKVKKDLIKVRNEYFVNEEFNNYNVSLHSKEWIKYLLDCVGRFVREFGFDGVFFDTAGNIESNKLNINEKYEQIHGFVRLLEMIRDKFKDIILVQNNGFKLLVNYTGDYIDAICLENIILKGLYSNRNNKIIFNKLNSMQENRIIKILLLTEKSNSIKKLQKIADKYNFLWYDAPPNYLSLKQL